MSTTGGGVTDEASMGDVIHSVKMLETIANTFKEREFGKNQASKPTRGAFIEGLVGDHALPSLLFGELQVFLHNRWEEEKKRRRASEEEGGVEAWGREL